MDTPVLTHYMIYAVTMLGVNLVPFFMPPSWLVGAFFYIRYDLDFVTVIVIGTALSTLGKIVIYTLTKDYLRRYLSVKFKSNMEDLGSFLTHHTKSYIILTVFLAFLPIPSSQLFIAAALGSFPLRTLAICFFFGRLVSSTIYTLIAAHASRNISDVFQGHLMSPGVIAIDILSITMILVLGRIRWKKILKIKSIKS